MASKTWRVEVDGQPHTVTLEHGYWSGKRRIQVDGETVVEGRIFGDQGSVHRFAVGGRPAEVHITTNGLTYRYFLFVDGHPTPGDALSPAAGSSAMGRRRRLGLLVWSSLVLVGLGWTGWAGMQALAANRDAEAFVHALPCDAGVPEPCRRVLTARVVETHSPRGSGAPWVRVSLPDGRTVQATRARDDYDGLVAELRSGDEVQVLTWRGDVVALRDAQGRILGTLATPSFGRLNWIMGALLGLFLVGAGVLGLCEQAIYHRRWSEHERLARAGEPPALPRVARSPAAPLLAAFFILGALLFPAAVLANAWLAGGVARWEALRHELLVGAMVGGAGLLIAWSRWGELRIETNRFVHRTWRTRTEVWFDDVERVITEPLPRGIGRAVCVVRRSAQTPVWLTTQQFHPCDLAVLLGALGRFKQDIDLDVNSRFLLAGTPWGHG